MCSMQEAADTLHVILHTASSVSEAWVGGQTCVPVVCSSDVLKTWCLCAGCFPVWQKHIAMFVSSSDVLKTWCWATG